MDEKKELTRGEELRRALCYNKKNGYDRMNPQEMEPWRPTAPVTSSFWTLVRRSGSA